MIENILMWLARETLKWVLAKGQKKLVDLYALAEEEKEFEASNKKATEKYNAAKDRLEKIKAATDLLNRTTT